MLQRLLPVAALVATACTVNYSIGRMYEVGPAEPISLTIDGPSPKVTVRNDGPGVLEATFQVPLQEAFTRTVEVGATESLHWHETFEVRLGTENEEGAQVWVKAQAKGRLSVTRSTSRSSEDQR